MRDFSKVLHQLQKLLGNSWFCSWKQIVSAGSIGFVSTHPFRSDETASSEDRVSTSRGHSIEEAYRNVKSECEHRTTNIADHLYSFVLIGFRKILQFTQNSDEQIAVPNYSPRLPTLKSQIPGWVFSLSFRSVPLFHPWKRSGRIPWLEKKSAYL